MGSRDLFWVVYFGIYTLSSAGNFHSKFNEQISWETIPLHMNDAACNVSRVGVLLSYRDVCEALAELS